MRHAPYISAQHTRRAEHQHTTGQHLRCPARLDRDGARLFAWLLPEFPTKNQAEEPKGKKAQRETGRAPPGWAGRWIQP